MDISGYSYHNSEGSHTNAYLLPGVFHALDEAITAGTGRRVFELGCGNGAVANMLALRGFEVVGVDPSHEGIAQANKNFAHLQLSVGSSEMDLAAKFGRFPFVLSLEVIEHVYAPRQFASRVFDLLEPGGLAIISTPYHGYFKMPWRSPANLMPTSPPCGIMATLSFGLSKHSANCFPTQDSVESRFSESAEFRHWQSQ